MKLLELKGYKSLRAFNGFHRLMLGMKMLPMNLGTSYEKFYEDFNRMSDDEQRRLLREAAMFVQLEEGEFEALASFVTDPNGIAYHSANIKNLGPSEMVDIIVEVSMAIGKIKPDILTENEKKKSLCCPLTSEDH